MAIEKVEIVSKHTNGMTKKRLHLKCDWCKESFVRNINIARMMKREVHFCGNVCAGKYKYKTNPKVRNVDNLLKSIEKMKTDKEYANTIKNKKKKTCLEKYGTKTPLESKDILERTKRTLKEKYGVVNPQHNKEVQEKTKQTCLERYGTEYQISSKQTREKIKESMLKTYGVEHSMSLKTTRDKVKKTCLERYGVENAGAYEDFILKAKKTNIEKYDADHYTKSEEYKKTFGKKFVKETGELLKDWLSRQEGNVPSESTFIKHFSQGDIEEKFLEKFLENWRSNMTSLEMLGEKLFETTHYNKKPDNIEKIYKPDFKLTEDIYVNVDGLYWHCETMQEDRRYHFNMRQHFEEKNLKLIQFREDEVRNKPDICKSIVDNAINKTPNKIYARKCSLKKTPHKEAKIFLNNNHLMGSTTAKHLGLYHEDKIVCILSFKEKNGVCKIERFCSLTNHVVIGGFTKLLKALEKDYLSNDTKEIHNWVDLRYGSGKHLLNKGFIKRKKDELGWKWTNYSNTFNRLRCRANMDDRKLTQQQHADELGWHKIYDAGQRLYIKTLLA